VPRTLALLVAAVLALPATAAAADLTVYSSLPLRGDSKPQSQDVLRGERLALEQAGGRAGAHTVRLVSLNDAGRRSLKWEPGVVVRNARRAFMDPTTIAYLGEFNSGATSISLPILNEAGILQVSPSNAYVGLTRAEGAEPREPVQYYPAGYRSYGRVVPADHLQAAAIAALLQAEGVKRVFLVDDFEVYGTGLADMVSSRLGARGIALAGRRHLRRRNAGAIARAIRRSKADAMVYAGITQNGAPRLWNAVHRRNPRLKLFGVDGVAERPFTRRLSRRAARRTLITNPVSTHPGGRAFTEAFRARFHKTPEPYAIYGYEAMSVVLDAIRRGGNSRRAVIDAFFATRDRDSVLGRYSIDANGDTTLSTYGVLKVTRRGGLAYDRTIDSAG
jgi:branched-chain amino acid transport system substrate-binding protein